MGGFGDAQGCLGDISDFFGVGHLEGLDVLNLFDDANVAGGLTDGADGFIVVAVADVDDGVAFAGEAEDFQVDLGDQGAGGVDFDQAAIAGLLADGGGNAVGGIDDDLAVGDRGDVIDKNHATVGEAVDHVLVMYDFVVDVDGGAIDGEGLFNDLDGHVDTCAKSAGICEDDTDRLLDRKFFHGTIVA